MQVSLGTNLFLLDRSLEQEVKMISELPRIPLIPES